MSRSISLKLDFKNGNMTNRFQIFLAECCITREMFRTKIALVKIIVEAFKENKSFTKESYEKELKDWEDKCNSYYNKYIAGQNIDKETLVIMSIAFKFSIKEVAMFFMPEYYFFDLDDINNNNESSIATNDPIIQTPTQPTTRRVGGQRLANHIQIKLYSGVFDFEIKKLCFKARIIKKSNLLVTKTYLIKSRKDGLKNLENIDFASCSRMGCLDTIHLDGKLEREEREERISKNLRQEYFFNFILKKTLMLDEEIEFTVVRFYEEHPELMIIFDNVWIDYPTQYLIMDVVSSNKYNHNYNQAKVYVHSFYDECYKGCTTNERITYNTLEYCDLSLRDNSNSFIIKQYKPRIHTSWRIG